MNELNKLIFITLGAILRILWLCFYFYSATVIQRYFNFSMEVLMLTGLFVLLTEFL